jgi:hypothetical protein
MKKLALSLATFALVFLPVAAQADNGHHGGNGASSQRIDWD